MSRTRVCVIGGGAIGLAAPAELAELGFDVVLIEKDQLVSGSSGLSVGVYSHQYIEPLDIQLRVDAYQRMCALERDHGLQPVVLDDPPADLRLARAGGAGEERGAVEHDRQTRAAILHSLHLRDHVLEEQERRKRR